MTFLNIIGHLDSSHYNLYITTDIVTKISCIIGMSKKTDKLKKLKKN